MTGRSLSLRGSYGSSQSSAKFPAIARKSSSKMLIPSLREKERVLPVICGYLGQRRVAMILLVALALLVFIWGSITVSKASGSSEHPCNKFALPPPPPPVGRQLGPRPCSVCYIPLEQARARMPRSPSVSPVLRNLTYVVDENPLKTEPHGGSNFGGYPSLKRRSDSFDIRESMTVHCGFVKGRKPGHQTGFDIDEADLMELEQFHEVIVVSAIFGNYDIIQQPKNISEASRKNVPFYMFVDEETETYMKNSTVLDSSMKVGLWRIIVVHNIPYNDTRRNGKVPKLLLHRILPNVRYSIWIDGKLQLVVDPYQVLERFLWSQNANFAISRHYRRFDVFEEAEANKAAGKYDNTSIDYQIEFYKREGLTSYYSAKFPITSGLSQRLIRAQVPSCYPCYST
uniref:TOD1/MUCI70 glycosyltransferase-like domain-containing protein n=1 Tax=Manihot esculenta TaxID=3983 RepID=A0A251J462_MANES